MKNIFLILAAAFVLTSCVQDNLENVAVESGSVESKLIFSDEDIIEGKMLVRFSEGAISQVEAGVTRSGGVRSGIVAFDDVLTDIGVTSFKRLFPVNVNYEERARAFGLHLWYEVDFESSAKAIDVARAFAAIGEVETVESVNEIQSMAQPVRDVPTSEMSTAAPMQTTGGGQIFNDPDLVKQWHYINNGSKEYYSGARAGADINAGEAWPITAGDSRIIVAIVDDAIKVDHPDLAANIWVNEKEKNGQPGVDDDGNGYVDDIHGFNFQKMSPNLDASDNDHGTHVAGTVAAVNNNGIGGCGIAGGTGKGDGVRLMSCQIFVGNKTTSDANSAKAYQYMADMGVAISQNSWGLVSKMSSDRAYTQGSAEFQAMKYFEQYGGANSGGCPAIKGGLLIFAAGNDGWDTAMYPGAYRDFISVTAMSCDFTPAYYTCYGRGSNITAPGGDYLQSYSDTGWTSAPDYSCIYSTRFLNGNNYGYMQGTSMACPHVSGVAALGLAHALALGKSFTVPEYKALLLTSVNELNRYCTGEKYGVTSTGQLTSVDLSKYEGKMGTGYIDAFRVLMNVEGTPCVPVRVGVKQTVDISEILGGSVATLTILDVSMSAADKTKIKLDGNVVISSTGRLQLKCDAAGSAIVTVKFVAGGDRVGSDTQIGGMEVTKKFAVLARGFATNGGWL